MNYSGCRSSRSSRPLQIAREIGQGSTLCIRCDSSATAGSHYVKGGRVAPTCTVDAVLIQGRCRVVSRSISGHDHLLETLSLSVVRPSHKHSSISVRFQVTSQGHLKVTDTRVNLLHFIYSRMCNHHAAKCEAIYNSHVR